MSYDDLADRLETATDPRRIVSLPDGSVDHRFAVRGLEGDRLDSRAAFGRQLLEGDGDAFSLEALEVRPGGQAVNAAVQVDALGDESALVGRLDHPVLADLACERHSIGEPTRIDVLALGGDDVLLAEPAPDGDVADRAFATLEEGGLIDADGYCCANWVTHRDLGALVGQIADAVPDETPIVVDPGHLPAADGAAIGEFFAALSAAPARVVPSVNPTECAAGAAAVDAAGDDAARRAAELREAIDVTAVVVHGSDEAIAATPDGTVSVGMLEVENAVATTGAGDRFSGALASALARDWGWRPALALGNACASRFVATGETGDRSTLAAFVRERR